MANKLIFQLLAILAASELSINPSHWSPEKQGYKDRVDLVRKEEQVQLNNKVHALSSLIASAYTPEADSEWLAELRSAQKKQPSTQTRPSTLRTLYKKNTLSRPSNFRHPTQHLELLRERTPPIYTTPRPFRLNTSKTHAYTARKKHLDRLFFAASHVFSVVRRPKTQKKPPLRHLPDRGVCLWHALLYFDRRA